MSNVFTRNLSVVTAAAIVLATPAAPLLAQQTQPARSLDQQAERDLTVAKSLSRAFNRAAETISPSVVNITQRQRVMTFPRGWFGPSEQRLQDVGAGSGVVVSPDGYILTNNHVIAEAAEVRVKFSDGREMPAKVIGTDPATDLGVIKVDSKNLTAARFGDSDELQVGDWVMAVGSPFGIFDNTVTAGIVSAKGRTQLASQTDEKFEDYIQTDAAINPGNSGGPLINLDGEVVGINSQIASRTGGSVGIGFAIPSTIARAVMDMIIRTGSVQRGWVGIVMEPVDPNLSAQIADAPSTGAVVTQIVPEGPGDGAGLRVGDIVMRFNGRVIDSTNRLRNAIAFTPPGTVVDLDVSRKGKAVRLQVTVGDTVEGRSMTEGGKALRPYGFTVQNLPEQIIRQLGGSAVAVNYIDPLSPAATAQLQAGDIVFMVDGQAVTTAAEFDRLVQQSRRDTIRLNVQRGFQRGYVDIQRRK
jgi:serine protease Do